MRDFGLYPWWAFCAFAYLTPSARDNSRNDGIPMNCKIGTMEWIFLIVATIILDIVQVILEFFVIGVILNRIIDIVVGFCLPIYFWFRGVNMKSWKNWLAFLGGFGLEEVGLGGDDGLPLWTAEVAVVWLTVVVEKRIAKQMQKHPVLGKAVGKAIGVMQQTNAPLNKNGIRLPRSQIQPLNQNGMRMPALPSPTASPPRLPMNVDGIRSAK